MENFIVCIHVNLMPFYILIVNIQQFLHNKINRFPLLFFGSNLGRIHNNMLEKNCFKMKLLKYILIAFLSIFILIAMLMVFARPYRIHGDSMEPAYRDGKIYFLNRTSCYLTPYRIGDVVIFNREDKACISRIVALDKDTIKINHDYIVVNNRVLRNLVQKDWPNGRQGTYGVNSAFQIPPGHVYVLFDNLSADPDYSRVAGIIPHSDIIGKIW